MWISTITITHASIDSDSSKTIETKKQELQGLDGAGGGIPGFTKPEPEELDNITAPTVTVKRSWNEQANAQAWVDFVLTYPWAVSGTVEQQI